MYYDPDTEEPLGIRAGISSSIEVPSKGFGRLWKQI
jgi:hypothetical protein